MEVILIGFILGVTGLILKIVGICIRNERVNVVGEWFDSAAAGFFIGLGIVCMTENVKLYTPDQVQSIVDKSACWTIDGQKRCGEDFTYENEKIKVEKKGNDTNIYLK